MSPASQAQKPPPGTTSLFNHDMLRSYAVNLTILYYYPLFRFISPAGRESGEFPRHDAEQGRDSPATANLATLAIEISGVSLSSTAAVGALGHETMVAQS